MSTLKPGDRAIVIRSSVGNEGKIVVVDRILGPTDDIGEYDGCRFDMIGADVVITSLGSPLASRNLLTKEVTLHRTAPYLSKWLRKLPEITEYDDVLLETAA